ncbi:hypothetical protein Bpfe_007992 [Biomphalaria pfeifferi]|uniref:Uncharacterized protein n=1 Tax=Biomphalaria pfeifferi TaxID=112525 RepID=A0AAD8BXT3_BIOPF|nr:hypothetical protein Bpfe_007992 [Biomphalaria pfeifferi]
MPKWKTVCYLRLTTRVQLNYCLINTQFKCHVSAHRMELISADTYNIAPRTLYPRSRHPLPLGIAPQIIHYCDFLYPPSAVIISDGQTTRCRFQGVISLEFVQNLIAHASNLRRVSLMSGKLKMAIRSRVFLLGFRLRFMYFCTWRQDLATYANIV